MTQPDLNSILLFMVAALNAFTAYISHRNTQAINHIQKSTNSMKDALVASTEKAALAQGTAVGRKEAFAELDEAARKDKI